MNVYMTLETPGYYLDVLDRDTGEKKRITDCSQILLYDQETDELALVSAAPDGIPGNHNSTSPAISGDGRWVAFWTFASNLAPDDKNTCETPESEQNCGDLFIEDLQTGTFQRVQIGRNLFEPAEAIRPDFSQNGEGLVFPLSGNDRIEQELNLTQNNMDIVALHLPTGKLRLVNLSREGIPGNDRISISADGQDVIAWLDGQEGNIFDLAFSPDGPLPSPQTEQVWLLAPFSTTSLLTSKAPPTGK